MIGTPEGKSPDSGVHWWCLARSVLTRVLFSVSGLLPFSLRGIRVQFIDLTPQSIRKPGKEFGKKGFWKGDIAQWTRFSFFFFYLMQQVGYFSRQSELRIWSCRCRCCMRLKVFHHGLLCENDRGWSVVMYERDTHTQARGLALLPSTDK